MRVDLEDLRTKRSQHHLRPILDRFQRSKIAQSLGVSYGYLCDILIGHVIPSRPLEKRMQDLADAIVEAEKAEA